MFTPPFPTVAPPLKKTHIMSNFIKNNNLYHQRYSAKTDKTYRTVWCPLWLRHHERTLYSFVDSDHSKAALGPDKFFLPIGRHVSCALTSRARWFSPNTNINEDLFAMATVSSKTESWAKALGGNHWQQVHVVIVGELLSLKHHAVKYSVGAAFQRHHRSASARFGQALVLLALPLLFRIVFVLFYY